MLTHASKIMLQQFAISCNSDSGLMRYINDQLWWSLVVHEFS